MDKLISSQEAIEAVEFGITYAKAIDIKTGEVRELFKESNEELMKAAERIKQLPSIQPEHKAVFNRDIAIEAICDEVMLWFDVSATKAYEIAETAVKRIEVRVEKMERGEQYE